jgi:hypothetical protein
VLAETIREYVDEANCLTRERRATSAAGQNELRKIDKAISGFLDAIKDDDAPQR